MIPAPQQQPPGAGAQMNGGAPMAPQMPPVDPAMMEAIEKTAKAIPWEDIVEVLRGGVSRQYRIDIETDSTVRGEVRQQQETIGLFLDGTAKFFESMFPIVQAGAMPPDVAVDLYSAFARVFRLGKQAEDALSRFGQAAQEAAKNPQPPAPDPEMLKLEMEAKSREQELQFKQAEAQQGAALEQQKMGLEQQRAQAEQVMAQQKAEQEMALKQQEIEAKMRLEEQKLAHQQKLEETKLASEQQLRAAEMQQTMQIESAKCQQQAATEKEKLAHQSGMEQQKMQRQTVVEDRQFAADKHQKQDSQNMAAEFAKMLSEVVRKIGEQNATQTAEIVKAMKAVTAPRRIVRDPKTNRAIGVEAV